MEQALLPAVPSLRLQSSYKSLISTVMLHYQAHITATQNHETVRADTSCMKHHVPTWRPESWDENESSQTKCAVPQSHARKQTISQVRRYCSHWEGKRAVRDNGAKGAQHRSIVAQLSRHVLWFESPQGHSWNTLHDVQHAVSNSSLSFFAPDVS